jgi:hypothetical protein
MSKIFSRYQFLKTSIGFICGLLSTSLLGNFTKALAQTTYKLYGEIQKKWQQLGAETSPLGSPVTDELDALYGGRFNQFQYGFIYWHPDIGAYGIWGTIGERYSQLGREQFGYPITDELSTPDNQGRFNHFRAIHLPGKPESSIYWTPETGAHEIYGAIRDQWAALGWERSSLGYPIDAERDRSDAPGREQLFQCGRIVWHPNVGTLVNPSSTLWGSLANLDFLNNRIKTAFFFSGQARDGSNRYGCPIPNQLSLYTVSPSDSRHLNWSVNQENRNYAISMMIEAGINVVSMSSWGESFLPCGAGWTEYAPMQTSPASHDELFDSAIDKALLIMPVIESRGDWTFRDEFPKWTDGKVAPGTVSQIVNLIQRYLKDPSHPKRANHWATAYDRQGNVRYAVSIIQVSSNRLIPNEHEAFAQGFDLIADAVLKATGERIGFFLDLLPETPNAPGSFKPSAQNTGECLKKTNSILGIQCFIPEIWLGSNNEADLLNWKREFSSAWFRTGIPLLMDVSPGYDARKVFGENSAPPNGWTQTWRDELSQLVNQFGKNGMAFNSWNGYTEKMAAVPTQEFGDVTYQWLKSLN